VRGTGGQIHCSIDLFDGQATVDIFHGLAGRLHGFESLLVDVGRLDAVYLAFERHDLALGLF